MKTKYLLSTLLVACVGFIPLTAFADEATPTWQESVQNLKKKAPNDPDVLNLRKQIEEKRATFQEKRAATDTDSEDGSGWFTMTNANDQELAYWGGRWRGWSGGYRPYYNYSSYPYYGSYGNSWYGNNYGYGYGYGGCSSC